MCSLFFSPYFIHLSLLVAGQMNSIVILDAASLRTAPFSTPAPLPHKLQPSLFLLNRPVNCVLSRRPSSLARVTVFCDCLSSQRLMFLFNTDDSAPRVGPPVCNGILKSQSFFRKSANKPRCFARNTTGPRRHNGTNRLVPVMPI